jgi:hypothetical protein
MVLIVAPDKVQKQSSFHIWDSLLRDRLSAPPKIEIYKDNFKNLNDFQKLLGDINWLCPALKLTTCELSPLFKILQGDTQPSSPRYLTPEGRMVLAKVEQVYITLRELMIILNQYNFLFYILQVYPQEFFGRLREY